MEVQRALRKRASYTQSPKRRAGSPQIPQAKPLWGGKKQPSFTHSCRELHILSVYTLVSLGKTLWFSNQNCFYVYLWHSSPLDLVSFHLLGSGWAASHRRGICSNTWASMYTQMLTQPSLSSKQHSKGWVSDSCMPGTMLSTLETRLNFLGRLPVVWEVSKQKEKERGKDQKT